ncbi:hypothetical protein NQZ68_024777 [Dissostichus eleginoides]|nr:hypothetical protein NQZ68_024777 [Dissostichus eleginoides]
MVQSRRNQHSSFGRVCRVRPPTTATVTGSNSVVPPAVSGCETGLPNHLIDIQVNVGGYLSTYRTAPKASHTFATVSNSAANHSFTSTDSSAQSRTKPYTLPLRDGGNSVD